MNYKQEIARILLAKNAVKVQPLEPFTWTSGIKSPIYCDNRKLISHPDAIKLIVDGFCEIISAKNLQFDYLAGTATAGIPWAAFLAERLNVPMVYVRSEPKNHGAGKQVEGDEIALNGKRGLIIEDLISTGGSSIGTARALEREIGGSVVAVLSIFEYGFASAKESFKDLVLDYYSLTDFPTLLSLMSEIQNPEAVLKFAENPVDWYKNFNS